MRTFLRAHALVDTSNGRAPARRLPIAVAVLCGVVIVTLWALALVSIARDFAQEEAAQRRVTESLVRALAEQTTRTLNLIDHTVLLVKRYHESGQPIDLSAMLAEMPHRSLFINITVVNAEGVIVQSTFAAAKTTMTATQRDYFEFHRKSTTPAMFVGRTVPGRFTGKTIIPFTRRIDDAKGNFAGVVVAAIDPDHFTDFYGAFELGAHDFVGVMGMDGFVRAGREAGRDPTPNFHDRRESAVLAKARESHFASFRATSPIDGVDRIMAIERLEPYALFVATGVSVDGVLDAPRKRARVLLAVVGASSLIVLALGILLYRAVSALERRTEASDNASRMKSDFIARMSHELRTPLHGILGFSEYLARRLGEPRDRESALLIHRSGKHLLSIVDSILDLAKIEAGKLELQIEDVDVAALVTAVASNHRVVAEGKGVDLRVDVATEARGLWRCDGVRLSSMLSNLLDNAAKFTDHGEVRVRVRLDPQDRLCFAVSDTGPGIAEADRARIFERFRQGETFVTRRHGGTGLGLALVRELAQLMGGSIALEPASERGATFVLTLPLERSTTNAERSLERAA